MLTSLAIRDVVLIERLDLDFMLWGVGLKPDMFATAQIKLP